MSQIGKESERERKRLGNVLYRHQHNYFHGPFPSCFVVAEFCPALPHLSG